MQRWRGEGEEEGTTVSESLDADLFPWLAYCLFVYVYVRFERLVSGRVV